MAKRYILTIGHQELAFATQEAAMRAYALLGESIPIAHPYVYGADFKVPESLEGIQYVRDAEHNLELKTSDDSKFALHLTEKEYKEKCRVQPTVIDGEARLIVEPLKLEGSDDDIPF